MAKGKKAVLVITDPGMPPTVFVVPDEALNEGDIKRLNRLLEYIGSYDFDAEEFQECANLKEVHNAISTQFGLEDDEEAPEFDWHPDQKLAVTRAEVKKREFMERYSAPVSGRLSSKGDHLANLPKPGPSLRQEAKKFDFSSPTGRLPPDTTIIPLNPSLQEKRIALPLFDYADLERRLIAAIGQPVMQVYDELIFEVEEKDLPNAREAVNKIFEESFPKMKFPIDQIGAYRIYDGGIGRLSSKGSNLQELPKKLKTPNGKEIERTWDPCCEGCLGWVHMNSPYEIESCDECGRFAVDCSDDTAIMCHREECGCGWPEFDVQDACIAWVGSMGPHDNADVQELSNLLDARGVEFMDNVTPAIYACSRLLENSEAGSPNHINGQGLMKLLKETQEKISNETLKLKDFGEPPGAEEEEEACCDDCGSLLTRGSGICPACDDPDV